LLPTAIGMGEAGANTPLAIAVIGGTTIVTILTLYVTPILYLTIEKN
jgi:multidrug efflux pump subunit AcrB